MKNDTAAGSVRNVCKLEVLASGPVTFSRVLAYCREQCPQATVDAHEVAEALTGLIRDGIICIGEDGRTFDVA